MEALGIPLPDTIPPMQKAESPAEVPVSESAALAEPSKSGDAGVIHIIEENPCCLHRCLICVGMQRRI